MNSPVLSIPSTSVRYSASEPSHQTIESGRVSCAQSFTQVSSSDVPGMVLVLLIIDGCGAGSRRCDPLRVGVLCHGGELGGAGGRGPLALRSLPSDTRPRKQQATCEAPVTPCSL